ncbi:MAG: glycosyltransferase family 4 protein [Cyanobacteria bacterium J06560_6]
MNILFFTSYVEPKDGWSVLGYNIVKSLESKAIHFEIFSEKRRYSLGLGHEKMKSSFYDKYKFLSIIYDFVNVLITCDRKPDLIHCNVEHYAPVAMLLSKIYRIPYTITACGTYSLRLPKKYKIYRKAFEAAFRTIAISHFTKKRMLCEQISSTYSVVLLGVDKSVFRPNPLIKKDNIITFVGNLKPRKGLRFLLESMVEVSKQKSNIKILVIGNIDFSGSAYSDIKRFISTHKLDVEFVGPASEQALVHYYQMAKLNILPSKSQPLYFEGFGLVHVEAIACGTLTIGTYNSGNEDAISAENGYLVEYGDQKELSEKILKVFSEDSYPSLNPNQINDWQSVAEKYLEIWMSACVSNQNGRISA